MFVPTVHITVYIIDEYDNDASWHGCSFGGLFEGQSNAGFMLRASLTPRPVTTDFVVTDRKTGALTTYGAGLKTCGPMC